MKKGYMRLIGALMCAVMLWGIIPVAASAVTLEEKKMHQLETAVPNANAEGEVYYFTDFASLADLAHKAASWSSGNYVCVGENDGAVVVEKNLTIPRNMRVEMKGDLVIPEGKGVTIQGSLSCQGVNVEGTLEIQPEAKGVFHGDVAVSGAMAVYGSITVNGEADISRNITFAEDSHPEVHCRFECEEDLRKISKQVEDSQEIWKFIAYSDTSEIYFSEPTTIPQRLTLKITTDDFVFSGDILTINGDLEAVDVSGLVVENILILNGSSRFVSNKPGVGVKFTGFVTNRGFMTVYAPVVFQGGIRNLHAIDIWCEEGGQVTFEQPQMYEDLSEDGEGTIFVNSHREEFPAKAFTGMTVEDFATVGYIGHMGYPFWYLDGYSRSVPHQHSAGTIPGKAATCLEAGLSDGTYCTQCGEVLAAQVEIKPLPHTYTNGKDADCNVCGAVRILDFAAQTTPMYRLYNPNSGEHFYTGSVEEKDNLVTAGWNYEGIAWNAPIRGGDPVYRLYNPNSGDHHYTMSAQERDNLVAVGWNYEGVCWNSAGAAEKNAIELFRLYNPNADCGSHHYTNSREERDNLVAAGWILEGIGWFGAGDHQHILGDATCTQPAACKICGVQRGATAPHDYQDATCFEPETCIYCGHTRGEPVGHVFVLGSCLMCGYPDPEFM